MIREKKKTPKKDIAATYNAYKEFEGHQYTGMKIGRSHKWYYDKGVWRDKKITPDLWEIEFEVTKRRAGKAPKGSGVPVGTEYHWYIMAHQMVKKSDANSYSTTMTGLKYKLAHKRADKDKWNVTQPTQRKRLIKVLKDLIKHLEKDPMEIKIPDKTKKSMNGTSQRTGAKNGASKKKTVVEEDLVKA